MENENQNKVTENNLESMSDFDIAFGPDNNVSNTEEEIEVLPDFNNANLSNPSIVQEDNQNLFNNLENIQEQASYNQEQSSVEMPEENQIPQSINTNLETQNNNEITFPDNNSQTVSTNETSITNNINMDTSNKSQEDDLLKSFQTINRIYFVNSLKIPIKVF